MLPISQYSICTYGILEHFSPQVKRGSHLSGKIISVTVVCGPMLQCIMLLHTSLMQSIWFAGEILSTHVHNTFSRPGLFLSTRPEFLERGEVLKPKFPRGGPSKKRVSIFFTKLLHRPGPLTQTMIKIERLRFRYIWSRMTRSIHEC